MSPDDVGGWAIFSAAFQIPAFLLVNGSWLGLILIDVVCVAALVVVSWLIRARLERGGSAPAPVVVEPARALLPVPPLAANAFVIDAEPATEVTR